MTLRGGRVLALPFFYLLAQVALKGFKGFKGFRGRTCFSSAKDIGHRAMLLGVVAPGGSTDTVVDGLV